MNENKLNRTESATEYTLRNDLVEATKKIWLPCLVDVFGRIN